MRKNHIMVWLKLKYFTYFMKTPIFLSSERKIGLTFFIYSVTFKKYLNAIQNSKLNFKLNIKHLVY